MADAPRMKDGGVIPPEWFDVEPTVISPEELKKSYSDKFRKELDDYAKELEEQLGEDAADE